MAQDNWSERGSEASCLGRRAEALQSDVVSIAACIYFLTRLALCSFLSMFLAKGNMVL